MESSSEIVFRELPTDDPKIRQPDISFARAKLQWEPEILLRDGLEKTISYFRQQLAAEGAAETSA